MMVRLGLSDRCSSPSLRVSSALSLNFSDDTRIMASLFSRIYRSSLAGKPEERGTAMLSHAKIESNVTVGC